MKKGILSEVRLASIGVVVAVALLTLRGRSFFDSDSQSAIDLAPEVRRVEWNDVDGVDIGSVAAVARMGNRFFLLDRRQARIAIIEISRDGWHYGGAFGRPGGGPGELEGAMDLAVNDTTVNVIEAGGRLSAFTPGGSFVGSAELRLPCVSTQTDVTFTASDTLVAVRCLDVGGRSDTLFALLYRVVTAERPTELARIPLYTMSGDWGTMYQSFHAVADYGTYHAFGTGAEDCVWRGGESGSSSLCGLDSVRLDVPESNGSRDLVEQMAETSGLDRRIYEWPKPFPAYHDKFLVGEELGLVRIASEDSVFLSWFSDPAVPLLVGPSDTFAGCDNGACLWVDFTMTGIRLAAYCFDGNDARRVEECRPTVAEWTVAE